MSHAQRYQTSFEALHQGLTSLDAEAIQVSAELLIVAHDQSRSRIVTAVSAMPVEIQTEVLSQWFEANWASEAAVWWVMARLERYLDPRAAALADALSLFERTMDDATPAVCVQYCTWLFWRASARRSFPVAFLEPVGERLNRWIQASDPALAVASLQAILAMQLRTSRERAANAVARGVSAGLREADFVGLQCGFYESADRLVEEIMAGGPWSLAAVDALCLRLPDGTKARLRAMLPSKDVLTDRAIHIATILGAHGDEAAIALLDAACGARDPRRCAVAWAGRVKALPASGGEDEYRRVWKLVLRQPESVRAWVLSGLNPTHPLHARWLHDAKTFGTEEEKRAVADALRAFARAGSSF